ncbi:TPA: hypothetical protein PXM37_004399 [Yersinia enterocolitica]|nr:hypothetical protein [Yersinia enterocolitica]HDL6983952.1 hypothetical protein [Yersinia enterocolitica]HDL7063889.1 hypothetical protein [Yersinia enterocolitica]HDL7067946.1 hypothetical protein [Yersinia enterocolitica]HDL7068270.1 hypothetical protein [Yersinia enterocolitica]
MKIEKGRTAVWEHAAEANMQETIRKIAALFDIDDIAIFTPGKLTYLKNKPRKYTRIRPLGSDVVINPITGAYSAKKGT